MPDSLRIKEIHAALEAQRYSKYVSTFTEEETPRVANIGYYVERIARILGINVLADGTAYTPPLIGQLNTPEGSDDLSEANIPDGYLNNQWGLKKDDIVLEFRTDQSFFEFDLLNDTDAPIDDINFEAMIYPVVTNQFVVSEETGEVDTIKNGGVALVHNLPQLFDVMMQDVDKGLGLQESGAFSIRSVESLLRGTQTDEEGNEIPPKLCNYEGLHSLVAENAFMLSEVSRRASKAEVVSMINQALLQEIMGIFGLPVDAKSFKATIGVNSESETIEKSIYFPAFANNAPRIYELFTVLMHNIAPLLGNNYSLNKETEEKIKNLSAEDVESLIEQVKSEIESGGSGL